jgi:hypothetical protein
MMTKPDKLKNGTIERPPCPFCKEPMGLYALSQEHGYPIEYYWSCGNADCESQKADLICPFCKCPMAKSIKYHCLNPLCK